ncbi:DMT family transporter [Streptomyces ipomoeae]|uniref:Putative membrane protein n=1 Tax=Streptomyces ipomoeae 91-03 TaxID=698759 RepID=L1KIM3_9ACTN|nr:EamA family transporter [Streptomyces ipomoeae]EKX60305.1 putative membrane protein [Streptomyces ipomoeae 91-03]MDX2700401.1 EamA family transporter [Streptomyces ipomoeae]MDX2846066.1 EamA family transporter [Streptomyces ipomoeae]
MTARGWFLFSLMGVLWGIPYLMIKVAVDGVSPSMVVFVRCALGAALLLPFAIRQGGLAATVRTHWRPMLAFAVIEVIGPWWTLTDAERHLSSSTAGLLIAGVPIVGVVLALPHSRLRSSGGTPTFGDTERLGARRVVGLGLGLAGVAVLMVPHLTGGDARSLAEVAITVVGYATAPLIMARHLKQVSTLQLIAPVLLLTAIVYAPAAALTWPSTMPSGPVLASLAGLGVICTALAFVAFLELIREVGPTRATVFTYVNPAVAVAAGALFLGEPLTPGILAAFALILAGSFLATAAGPKPSARPVTWSPRQTSRADGRVDSP